MNEHISADLGLYLATLELDHPDRRAAEAHALTCPSCRRVLRDSSLLLESQESVIALDPQLRQRILLAAVASARQEARRSQQQLGLALGMLCSVGLAWLDAHHHPGTLGEHGPLCMLWSLLGASLALLAGGLWAWRGALRLAPLGCAIVAFSGGLAAQVILRWACPGSNAGLHVLLFHVTGTAAAALLGLLVGHVAQRIE